MGFKEEADSEYDAVDRRVRRKIRKEEQKDGEETETPSQGSFLHLLLLLVFTTVLNLCMIGPQQVGFPVIAIQHLSEGVDGLVAYFVSYHLLPPESEMAQIRKMILHLCKYLEEK